MECHNMAYSLREPERHIAGFRYIRNRIALGTKHSHIRIAGSVGYNRYWDSDHTAHLRRSIHIGHVRSSSVAVAQWPNDKNCSLKRCKAVAEYRNLMDSWTHQSWFAHIVVTGHMATTVLAAVHHIADLTQYLNLNVLIASLEKSSHPVDSAPRHSSLDRSLVPLS